jgi:uncharacterized protein YjbI with pentapeptide repeats
MSLPLLRMRAAAEKRLTEPKPQKPKWAKWGKFQWTNLGILFALAILDWICQQLSYFLVSTSFGKAAEQVAKLSIFAVAFLFIFTKSCELANHSRETELRHQAEVRQSIAALSPKSGESKIARQWAFLSLRDHLNSEHESPSIEARQFYNDFKQWQFSGLDLSQLNLSKQELNQRNLSEANLARTNLSSAALRDTNLSEAILFGAILIRADLAKAHLNKTQLARADLRGANLSEADLSDASLWDVERGAGGAFVPTAAIFDSSTKLKKAILKRSQLCHVDFNGADLSEADLQGASLTGRKQSGTYPLCNATSFRNTTLVESNLNGLDLTGVNFSGAKMKGAFLLGADLTGAIGLTAEQLASANTDSTTKRPKTFATRD